MHDASPQKGDHSRFGICGCSSCRAVSQILSVDAWTRSVLHNPLQIGRQSLAILGLHLADPGDKLLSPSRIAFAPIGLSEHVERGGGVRVERRRLLQVADRRFYFSMVQQRLPQIRLRVPEIAVQPYGSLERGQCLLSGLAVRCSAVAQQRHRVPVLRKVAVGGLRDGAMQDFYRLIEMIALHCEHAGTNPWSDITGRLLLCGGEVLLGTLKFAL